MKRFLFVISLIWAGVSLHVSAQWNPPLSHYWAVKGFYNPAFAGETDNIRQGAVYRYSWAGIKGSPNLVAVTADMPVEWLGPHNGVGIVLYNATLGNASNSLIAGQYAFRRKIGKTSFAVGVQVEMYNLKFDAGSLHLVSDSISSQPTIQGNSTDRKILDFNAGVSWSGKNFYLGAAVHHLSQPTFSPQRDSLSVKDTHTDSIVVHIPRSYNFMASCNIPLIRSFIIQPMVCIQSDFTADWQLQATLRLIYDNKFSLGSSWIKDDGIAFFAGATIQGFEGGYAYTWHREGVWKESKGSHEAYLRYNFSLDTFKPKRHPHKSVRIL